MSPDIAQAGYAVAVLVGTGLVLGLLIGIIVKVFGTETDPRVEEVEGLLPGANCGACGFAGCAAFAQALAEGKADPADCPSTSDEAVERICSLLGIAAGARQAKVAVVRCGGDNSQAVEAARYNGVADCKDAMLVAGGTKGCRYGCLGLATCARVCPFDAIEITDKGIARVHPDLCTGCGKCVDSCPRDLIELVPRDVNIHVLCNSPEKGAAKRKVCKVSCIGCRKCVKASEENQMIMKGFLAHVNDDNPPDPAIAEVCPTGCLVAVEPVSEATDHDSEEQEQPKEVANA